MAFVTTDKNSSRMGIQISKSIDDEHTPGVFEVSHDVRILVWCSCWELGKHLSFRTLTNALYFCCVLFQLYDWVSNKKNESRGSYVQWKPVCYTLPKRAITAITKAKNYDITSNISKEGWCTTLFVTGYDLLFHLYLFGCVLFVNTQTLFSKTDLGNERSLAYVYFGDDMYSSHVALTMTNVSFGLSKDKFYTLNNYSVWWVLQMGVVCFNLFADDVIETTGPHRTSRWRYLQQKYASSCEGFRKLHAFLELVFLVCRSAGLGFGKPPADTISTTIIIVILCGLGIPAALIIFGGIAVCVKKRKDRYKGYEDLSENDGVVNT